MLQRIAFLLLAAALAITGCAIPFLPAKTEGSGVFVVALDSPVLTLDPAHITELSSARVAVQIYETLVEHNPATGGFDPLLAQTWEVSADGRVWTFVLRSGVTFHDGTPLNADAVIENFNRWMDTTNRYHHGDFDYWQLLFGGFKGSGSLVRSVLRADDLRVQVVLEQPWGGLLAALSMFPFAIVSPAAMQKDVDLLRRSPIGSGPFRFVEWKGDAEINLTAYPGYWGGKPKLGGVWFRTVPDAAARLEAVRNGNVHLAEGGDAATVTAARRTAGVVVVQRPSQSIAFLSINQKAEPFAEQQVRQSVALGINRQALAEKAYAGLAQPADQFVPPGVAGYDRTLGGLAYDPIAARQAMENAGIAGSIISQLWYPSRPRPFLPNPRAVAEAIAADLQAIGIKVVLNTADWTTYQRRALDGGYPLYLQGWTGDSPDADGFLSGLFTGDTVARSIGYTNPDLTAALAGGRSQSDAVTRLSIYRQAAAIVRRDMARVPLVYPQSAVLLSNRVTGFAPSLLGVESLRTTSLSK